MFLGHTEPDCSKQRQLLEYYQQHRVFSWNLLYSQRHQMAARQEIEQQQQQQQQQPPQQHNPNSMSPHCNNNSSTSNNNHPQITPAGEREREVPTERDAAREKKSRRTTSPIRDDPPAKVPRLDIPAGHAPSPYSSRPGKIYSVFIFYQGC